MQQLINEMKSVFNSDKKRINHALDVLRYTVQIQQVEGGSNQIIAAAAVLHDIGIKEAERKYNSSEGKTKEEIKKFINKVFKTKTGGKLALELFVNNNVNQKV
ncbi:MAG: HD domain-containing protein [Phycisphaerae bacterium]|nr:HD domain-containing protein [Phycisphaerae bacterium]